MITKILTLEQLYSGQILQRKLWRGAAKAAASCISRTDRNFLCGFEVQKHGSASANTFSREGK